MSKIVKNVKNVKYVTYVKTFKNKNVISGRNGNNDEKL